MIYPEDSAIQRLNNWSLVFIQFLGKALVQIQITCCPSSLASIHYLHGTQEVRGYLCTEHAWTNRFFKNLKQVTVNGRRCYMQQSTQGKSKQCIITEELSKMACLSKTSTLPHALYSTVVISQAHYNNDVNDSNK